MLATTFEHGEESVSNGSVASQPATVSCANPQPWSHPRRPGQPPSVVRIPGLVAGSVASRTATVSCANPSSTPPSRPGHPPSVVRIPKPRPCPSPRPTTVSCARPHPAIVLASVASRVASVSCANPLVPGRGVSPLLFSRDFVSSAERPASALRIPAQAPVAHSISCLKTPVSPCHRNQSSSVLPEGDSWPHYDTLFGGGDH